MRSINYNDLNCLTTFSGTKDKMDTYLNLVQEILASKFEYLELEKKLDEKTAEYFLQFYIYQHEVHVGFDWSDGKLHFGIEVLLKRPIEYDEFIIYGSGWSAKNQQDHVLVYNDLNVMDIMDQDFNREYYQVNKFIFENLDFLFNQLDKMYAN